MAFTHYPKLAQNVLFAWVWPAPPDKKNFLNFPRFSRLNRMTAPLVPGTSFVAFHEAQNFTRFYGSIFSDQPLEISFDFSNDEVAPDGEWVQDSNIDKLHYDAEALKLAYDPMKHTTASKYLVTIYGRWLRVSVKNVGTAQAQQTRIFVRGSVF